MPLEGGPAVPLIQNPGIDMFSSWSPDGGNGTGNVDVFVVPASGGEAHRITNVATEGEK